MASSTVNCANIPGEDSHSHTNFKVAKYSHTWTISNFCFTEQTVGHCLTSVNFPLKGDEERNAMRWCLKLYPNGEYEDHKEFLSVFLHLLAAKKNEVKAMLTVGVITAKGARHVLGSSIKADKFEINSSLGWANLIKRKDLLNKKRGLMQGDKLVLFCEVKVLTDVSNESERFDVIQFTEPRLHLLANIGDLFETKKFSDVTITAGGKEFHVHKNILAAQSPVFSAMFEHDMLEKKQSRVDIIDMDYEVVRQMLLFLYTGEAKNIQKIAADLLAAAEKYALEKLKFMCEEALRASLTIETAADTLILADLHSAHRLKTQVIRFVCFYAAQVVTTVGFNLMVRSHPSLIAEAFCAMAQSQNVNSSEVSETDAAAPQLNARTTNTL